MNSSFILFLLFLISVFITLPMPSLISRDTTSDLKVKLSKNVHIYIILEAL